LIAANSPKRAANAVSALIGFDAVPFHIGFFERPSNPAPFPDLLPLHLGVDLRSGLLRQIPCDEVPNDLRLAHARGALLGTAMDDTTAGRAYADDFLTFVAEIAPLAGRSVLEIGAGRGYLVKLLRDAGADALGIEPGSANAAHWVRHGVPVVEDSFPTPKVAGAFDLIVAYTLLQQIEDLAHFLAAVRRRLKPGGWALFAVPDCTGYIADGDPGMLLHALWSYFTPSTLTRVLAEAGFTVERLRPARHGGVIYAAAIPGEPPDRKNAAGDLAAVQEFGQKCRRLRTSIARRLNRLSAAGRSLGVYVPGRAALWLDPEMQVRFFDDDPELTGRYYPPFAAAIENRQSLLERPVDELWIMSRNFGAGIENALRGYAGLRGTRILGIDALLAEASAN
jgi:SAM-dependent methyltransferase